jgi:peptidoglycan/xylan/chitin deacetylase (PgdA/CDA1 family)
MELHLTPPKISKVTALAALRLFLTACLGCLIPVFINVHIVLAPPNEENAPSLALLQPGATHLSTPTLSPTNPPPLTATPTSTPVVMQVITPTTVNTNVSQVFLPFIERLPLATSPMIQTTPTSHSLPLPVPTLPTATPTPKILDAARHIPIIEYHYSTYNVDNRVMMTSAWFENQIKWLADNGFTTLSAADLVAYLNGDAFPKKSVVLTFDIGTAQKANFTNEIIPTLEKYKFTALFFLLVNDSVVTDNCASSDKFCWDDLRKWQQDGTISVESHGIRHADYDNLTRDQMSRDAGGAFETISAKVGTPPLGFAYPYDSIPSQAPGVIQSLGYQFAVGGNTRSNRSVGLMDADRYFLPRLYPYSNLSIYPIIGGSNGLTFDEILTSLIAGS